MCGIVAVARRASRRSPPDVAAIASQVAGAASLVERPSVAALLEVAAVLERADAALCGVPGAAALLGDRDAGLALERACDRIRAVADRAERDLEASANGGLEDLNAALVRLRDVLWSLSNDRPRHACGIEDLAGGVPSASALAVWSSIEVALSALDRLEVRGRDSAGLHVLVYGTSLDTAAPSVRRLLEGRADDSLFRSRAVRAGDGWTGFVYKAAAEIGEYGDNTRALREAIRSDELLRVAVNAPGAEATVLAHTRWASVGIISQANAHPLDHTETSADALPYTVAVLNGDVDNYADLKATEGLAFHDEITTDAKVIPALVARRLRDGGDLGEAFRRTAAGFEGSVAVGAVHGGEPHRLAFALRGSGQALYVGIAEDAYVVASEPYGLIEEATSYLRMDGETPDASGVRGQVVVLDAREAGDVSGVRRVSYGGADLPVEPRELKQPDITTRDIARGDHAHYLVKEISESPSSFRKTLRGRIVARDGQLTTSLGPQTLPDALVAKLRAREIERIYVIGQGTAAVAGRGVAAALEVALAEPVVSVHAMPTSELSGFHLRDDMSDSLVIAISQSGTSADTNRSVDLARDRGAWVVSVVNRRGSDLVDKSDGVMFTSDGRDVEMAVPSTKAFYAQIAAGFLLAFQLAEHLGAVDAGVRHELLTALADLPTAMEEILRRRPAVAAAAQRHAPTRRNWSVVGNGVNRVAAEEVRIKLAELCYKSIACDVTEDKKHIDLSAEPLILVCAAGLSGSNADDVAMDVARFRAHKAAPIVVASEGEQRYTAALEVLWVPECHPALAFVLSAMAGHLFGYEAALAIDAQAHPLREARAAVERALSGGARVELLDELSSVLAPPATRFFEALRAGFYDGSLEASTAVRVASQLRYATKVAPLESYQVEFGKVGTPSVVVEDLIEALTRAIDELTRPVDAIKHQAKTVTVGISRSDQTLLRVPLVAETLAAGAPRDRLSYRALRTLAALDAAVESVTGFTRYRVEGRLSEIHIVDRGGIARDLRSRTEDDPSLRGTKHRAAFEREVTVARGHDGRSLVIVPEVKGNETTGITLLHARMHDRLPAATMRAVLEGYRDRFGALQDAVTESQPVFRDDLLETVPVLQLLTEPVYVLAAHWR